MPAAAAAAAASPDPEQDKALAKLKALAAGSPDLLLSPGTNLSANGCLSYDEAIRAGYRRVVEFFLDHGASADRTPRGESPLAVAALSGQAALVELLLEKGALIDGAPETENPLAAAARGGHLAIARLLLDKGAKPDGSEGALAPLYAAAAQGHKTVMTLLLERGADPGCADNQPLILAITAKRLDLVELLLEKGAPPDKGRMAYAKDPQRFESGHNPTLISGVDNDQGSLPVSLEYAGYLSTDQSSKSRPADAFRPIHLACLQNQPEILKLLIAKGADVNALTLDAHSSALEIACVLNRLALGEMLVAAGAKADLPVPGGLRLVDLALYRGSLPWYELMRKAGAVVTGDSPNGMSPMEVLLTGTLWGNKNDPLLERATRVLNDGADPNGNSRFQPILHAAVTQDSALVRLLKTKGADFNPPGSVPAVAALVAAVCGESQAPGKVPEFPSGAAETVQALLDGGADLNAVSERESKSYWLYFEWKGYTALDILAVHLPDVDSLNRFLSFKPMVSTAPEQQTPFVRAQGEYTLLRNFAKLQTAPGKSFVPAVQPSYVVQQSRAGVVAGSVDAILKSAPATLRRLWEYGRVERNPEFGSRVWVQVFDPDKEQAACRFVPASEAGAGPVSLAEALAAYGKKDCLVPDFTKLEVLARSPEAEGGALVLRRTYDLAALTAAAPGGAPGPVPLLEPGEVLNLHPVDDKGVKSWREFPEPAASWIRMASTRLITVKAGAWLRVFKVVPELEDFRWDPATDVLAVKPTLRTVLHYLPKPEWFYRIDRIAVNEPGDASAADAAAAAASSSPAAAPPATPAPVSAAPDKWFNLHFPGTADKDPVLTSGTVITLEEIPADDPDLAKRKTEGVFVCSPKDGFLREVFRNANPLPGIPESPVSGMEVLREFYQKGDCVIPFPDLDSLTFRQNAQDKGPLKEPWGGELTVSRTGVPGAGMELSFHLEEPLPVLRTLKLKVRLPQGRSREIAVGLPNPSFSKSTDGWVSEPGNIGYPNQPAGLFQDMSVSTFSLEAVSERLFGDRSPDKARWLKLQSMEKTLAFHPNDSPLPFIVLKDGDEIILDPSDKEALLDDPPSVGRIRTVVPSSPRTVIPPDGVDRRIVLPPSQ